MNIFERISKFFRRKTRFIFGRNETAYKGQASDNDTIKAIADCVGRNIGKATCQFLRSDENRRNKSKNNLEYLLTERPNPEMTAYDFQYRIAHDIITDGNSYSIIFWNDDYTEVVRIQPVKCNSVTIFPDEKGTLYFRFRWDYDGMEYTVPYDFVIHIKGHFGNKRFFGSSPDDDIQRSSDLLETTYNGIENSVKNSAGLRGYLKYANISDSEDLKEVAKDFQASYLRSENEGGIAALDSTMDFTEFKQTPAHIPTQQISLFKQNILDYYGFNQKILNSDMDETTWNGLYESILEPILINLTQEINFKLANVIQKSRGNQVRYYAERLQYISITNRAAIGKDLLDRGAITLDEYREMLYLPPLPNDEGKIRIVSLNYVKTDEQSQYQLGE